MRFPILAVTGLVCIVLGVAGSEWSRRHPRPKPAAVVAAPPPVLTAQELAAIEVQADLPADDEALRTMNVELAASGRDVRLPEEFTVPQAAAVLGGSLFGRNAVPHGNALFLVSEEGKHGARQSLLRITAGEPARALAVHRPAVGAIAVDGSRLYWAEGGALFSIDATSAGPAKGLALFPRARVTSLGISGNVLVASLVPRELDPFSSEPVGAVVSLGLTDGKVKVLASQQVRPSEAGTDGKSAVWTAGYPSALWAVALDGGEPRSLSARADGPVLLENGFVTFRHPVTGSPEVVRLAISGGEPRILARGEVDRLTQQSGDVWFSIGGTVSRVDGRGEHETVVARLPHPVLELAATDDALYLLTRQEAGGHLLVRLPRSSPEGGRP